MQCPRWDPGTEREHYGKTGDIQIKSEAWLNYNAPISASSFGQICHSYERYCGETV